MEPFGLIQLISEATRVTPLSKTLIDHIYTNCPENVNSINIPQIGLSDHFLSFSRAKCTFNHQNEITSQYPTDLSEVLMKLNSWMIYRMFLGIL